MKRLGLGLLTSALAAAAFAPLAHAADLPAPVAPAPAPVYRPALYDWTGIYIGGNVGAGFLNDSYSQGPGAAALVLANNFNMTSAGVIGGGQVGANYEFAPWVIGVEGSWDSTSLGVSRTVATTTAATFERLNSNPLWIASATGRLGYASDASLFYVKGGGAWMNVDYTQVTGATQVITDTRTGFTAGAGFEYGFVEGWSGKIEYNFYGFGSKNYGFLATPVTIKSDVQTVTVGINYRFNWAGGRPY